MTTDRHMEKAREMLMSLSDDRNPDTQADVTIIATALAEAEREGMRRAAEIANQHHECACDCGDVIRAAILAEAGIAVTDK